MGCFCLVAVRGQLLHHLLWLLFLTVLCCFTDKVELLVSQRHMDCLVMTKDGTVRMIFSSCEGCSYEYVFLMGQACLPGQFWVELCSSMGRYCTVNLEGRMTLHKSRMTDISDRRRLFSLARAVFSDVLYVCCVK